MKKPVALSLSIVLLLIGATLFLPHKTSAVLEEIKILRYQAIPMRDGVKLYGDVYLPRAAGRYPALIVRTPYGVQRDGAHEALIKFAQRGYAIVMNDVRGRYESEGKWEPFRNEDKDGYDTIQWAAKQPWSNGKVATQGGVLSGACAMGGGQVAAAESGSDVSGAGFDQHLSGLDYAQRRVAAFVQLRLGRSAHAQSHYVAAVLAYRKFCAP